MFPHLIKHHLNNSSRQEDDENYCNKDDNKIDNKYDRFPGRSSRLMQYREYHHQLIGSNT